ncbi:MAG: hypothetical protein QME46_05330 [Thermoanaerobacteraceae bacterium]|nr:hypothetical protein [Thermoanaerobacteraceae bacterium]
MEPPAIEELEGNIGDNINLNQEEVQVIKREATASILGFVIIGLFAVINIIMAVWGLTATGGSFDNVLELIKTFNQIITGPLGFVLGYYYANKGSDAGVQ